MEPKTGRRIVSKGEYAANVSKKSSLTAFDIGVMGLGVVGILNVVTLTILGLGEAIKTHHIEDIALTAFVLLIGGGVSVLIFWAGRKTVRKAKQIKLCVPLTRANTADLPALDSLVRASSEPMQAQQSVLLRAATEGLGTPPEELVRASAGQE